MSVVAEAAAVIRELADDIKHSHTLAGGEWDPVEVSARRVRPPHRHRRAAGADGMTGKSKTPSDLIVDWQQVVLTLRTRLALLPEQARLL